MCLKAAGCMVNSVDPDQTPRSVASGLGLHCLLKPICSNAYFNAFVGKPGFFSKFEKVVTVRMHRLIMAFDVRIIFNRVRLKYTSTHSKKKRNTAKWQTKLKMMPYIFKTDLVCKLGCKSTIVSISKLFITQYKVQ